jgi:hypothetical protein
VPKLAPVHWTVLEKIVLLDGWQFDRQEGSHRSYVKPFSAVPRRGRHRAGSCVASYVFNNVLVPVRGR